LKGLFKCKYYLTLFILISTNSIAATWSNFAVPTRVDIVRNDGFMAILAMQVSATLLIRYLWE